LTFEGNRLVIYWLLGHILNAAFWSWVVFYDGAERLEGSFASGFLINIWAPGWTAEGIRFFGWVALIAGGIGFVVGLIVPSLR
jgi:hypothetical protein